MKPPGLPGLVGALRERVPARVQRKLEGGNPSEQWTWARGSVTTDKGQTVTLPASGPVGPDDLSCTCLLSPKCLHILAVALALPAPDGGVAEPEPVAAPERPIEPDVRLDGGQRAVVGLLERSAAELLVAGAQGAGPTALASLKRGIHGARAVGLPRLARAGARVLRGVRALQREKEEFRLEDLVEDLRELAAVARVLGMASVGASWVGTARMRYSPIGTLRVRGVCTEPVIAGTGHAGVTTWLADDRGRLWSINNVLPGGPDRARSHYDAAVGTGGATLPHRELSRTGLFLQDATASSNGRIGTGGGVRAARAGGGSWSEAPLRGLWDGDFGDRVVAARDGLFFLDGVVLGAHRDAVVLETEAGAYRLLAPSDHRELAYHDNLKVLARASGLRLRLVARPAGRRRALHPIAIGPHPAPVDTAVRLVLPDEWSGRCNLGFDRLIATHLPGLAGPAPELMWEDMRPDPLAGLRRRVGRMALGGRRTLPGEARGEIERDVARLQKNLLPTAAAALLALSDAALPKKVEVIEVGAAWLRAAVVVSEATLRLRE